MVVHAGLKTSSGAYNPLEYDKTNVIGSQNVNEASIDAEVEKVIALSTDKAVSPINLYGATKLCSDKLFVAANNITGKQNTTFSIVRYGNVLGSRGSILDEFIKQNKLKQKFKITDLKMTRFNILMKDAIELVIWSINNLSGGEIVIPKLKSLWIKDLAKSINKNSKFNIIGIRPGEKLHEELMSKSDSYNVYELKDKLLLISNQLTGYKRKSKNFKKLKNFTSYNSLENKFLKVSEIKKLINQHLKK